MVLTIAAVLNLGDDETDVLLASAGYWPRTILRLGPQDETLLAVARLLARGDIGGEAKRRFRDVTALLIEEWLSRLA